MRKVSKMYDPYSYPPYWIPLEILLEDIEDEDGDVVDVWVMFLDLRRRMFK